jgi:hypothetical protein
MSNSIELVSPSHLQQEPNHQLAEEIVHTYRGWDAYEREHGGPDIIDFDVSKDIKGRSEFKSREEILSALQELYKNLRDTDDEHKFLRARIQGSITYLGGLMGRQMDFQAYVLDTLGVNPQPFSSREIARARVAVSESLEPYGLKMQAKDRQSFESQLLIKEPSAIREGIVGMKDFWLERLRRAGIPVPEQVHLSVEFTEEDAYWSNWISNWTNGKRRKEITLSINLHPRKKYDLGRPLVLGLHEVCGHAAQMSIWREQIKNGEMHPACGLTTVHAPEAFVAEGLAQTVADLLSDEEFPPEFTLSRALSYYTLMVLHNAHLMIYEDLPEEKILDYACDQLPLSDPADLRKEIDDRRSNQLYKSYLLSYAIGEHTIRGLIEGMSPARKRRFFLEMYTKPLTPRQLKEVGKRIGG